MAAALRTALGRLGFSDPCCAFIVDIQGMDSLEEFAFLLDSDVENLCRVCRKPGGTLAAPTPTDANRTIPHAGFNVSWKAEANLKLACYFLRYKANTSTNVVCADITLNNVRALREHKAWEEQHKDVDPPTILNKNWPRNIEALEEYLRGCLGVTGIPLAYVVRSSIDPVEVPADGWSSRQDELINRAPILAPNTDPVAYNQNFVTDRTKVWELLSAITRELDYCWSYVKPAQRTRDGRKAFTGLKDHYLGQNHVDTMASKAEIKLQTTFYHGEKRNFTFEKYVRTHVDQHAILETLMEHGYTGIDARSKVRYLNTGIKTKALDSVKTQIMATPSLRSDFDACVNLYMEFISTSQDSTLKTVTIAATSEQKPQDKNNSDFASIKPDMSVEDRYYKTKDYKSLSVAKKKGLQLMRKSRGQNPKNKKPQRGKLELSKRSIAAVAAALRGKDDEASSDNNASDSDEENEGRAKRPRTENNRNHKALTRKMKNGGS